MAPDEYSNSKQQGIDLPAPTSAPFVCAFGVTLIFAGIVTNWAVSILGFVLALVGAIRWWHEVLPDNRKECIPFQSERPIVKPKVGGVAHLMTADSPHRARIPMEIHPYGAGIKGGIAGGIVMAIIAGIWGVVSHGSVWYPVNILGATILLNMQGEDATQLAQWDTTAFIVGIVIHAIMSSLVGLLYGIILPMVPHFRLIFSAIAIPLIWTGLTWASLEVINPLLQNEINWLVFIGSQVGFGITCWFVVSRSERIGTMQNWSMMERIGIESPNVPSIGGDE